MLIDARKELPSKNIQTDICIIGAGAAGITLAKELQNTSYKISLLESGGFEADEETQSLAGGVSIGVPYNLSEYRTRYFGGTTNKWYGICRPFNKVDFDKREWIPYSGWPFTKKTHAPILRTRAKFVQSSTIRLL